MAVSQGSFTVGGLAADYLTLATAFGDVASPLTGDLTFTVIANHSSSAAGTLLGLDLQAHRLTVTADVGPQGDVDGGRIISMATDAAACYVANVVDSIGGGEVVIERLNVRNTGPDYDAAAIHITTGTSGVALFGIVRDCIVDNRNATSAQSGSAIDLTVLPTPASRVHTMYVSNCMVVGHYSQSNSACFELRGQYYGYVVCENCVAQPNSAVAAATGFLITVGNNVVVRNCVGVGGGVTYGDFYGTADAAGYNNMSEDGHAADELWNIGAGNVALITPADEYISVDPDDGATWFEPKSTGSARDGGAAAQVPGNNHGAIETIARPHDTNKYSIGAKEYPSSPVITGHPSLEQVDEGTPASFTVVATDATGYQWEEGPLPGVGEARVFADMTGETSDVLDILSAGSSLHQYQYRCKVSNAAGEVTSDAAYLLINGLPEPGGGGATSPERPTVSLTGINGLELTFDVAGDADVFRAEVTDPTSQVAAYAETTVEGALVVTLPHENIEYVVSVYAGNFGSVVWSLPGYVLVILVAPSPVPSPPGEPLDISDEEPIFSDVDPELRTDHQGNILVLTNAQAMTASIENIFDMSPGELVMDPLFGGEMKNMIAQNIDRSSAAFVRMAINHSLKQDPRVKRDKLTVIPRPSERVFKVILEFSENEGYIRGLFETLLEK